MNFFVMCNVRQCGCNVSYISFTLSLRFSIQEIDSQGSTQNIKGKSKPCQVGPRGPRGMMYQKNFDTQFWLNIYCDAWTIWLWNTWYQLNLFISFCFIVLVRVGLPLDSSIAGQLRIHSHCILSWASVLYCLQSLCGGIHKLRPMNTLACIYKLHEFGSSLACVWHCCE